MSFLLATPRTRLRSFVDDDLRDLCALHLDADVMRFLVGGVRRSPEDVTKDLAFYRRHEQEHGFSKWAVVDAKTSRFLGRAGLIRIDSAEIDIGYALCKEAWGKGLATEIATAMVAWAERELPMTARLVGLVHPEHGASARVLTKVGFDRCGQAEYFGGLFDVYRPSATALSFRPATERDLPAILRLLSGCLHAMSREGIEQWDAVYPDEAVLRCDIEAGHLFLAKEGGRLVGCLVLDSNEDPAYAAVDWRFRRAPVAVVHRLMIDPQSQGRGLARRFMAYAEAQARYGGYATLRLDAFTENPRAVALYEKLGYHHAGIIRLRKGLFHCFEKPLSNLESQR